MPIPSGSKLKAFAKFDASIFGSLKYRLDEEFVVGDNVANVYGSNLRVLNNLLKPSTTQYLPINFYQPLNIQCNHSNLSDTHFVYPSDPNLIQSVEIKNNQLQGKSEIKSQELRYGTTFSIHIALKTPEGKKEYDFVFKKTSKNN